MGAWGHKPFDSDQALELVQDMENYSEAYDFLSTTLDGVNESAYDELSQYGASGLVAVANGNEEFVKASVLRSIGNIPLNASEWQSLAGKAQTCCQQLADNQGFLNSWNHPEKIEEHLQTLALWLEQMQSEL